MQWLLTGHDYGYVLRCQKAFILTTNSTTRCELKSMLFKGALMGKKLQFFLNKWIQRSGTEHSTILLKYYEFSKC